MGALISSKISTHEVRLVEKLVQTTRLSRTTGNESKCCQGLGQGASGKQRQAGGKGTQRTVRS